MLKRKVQAAAAGLALVMLASLEAGAGDEQSRSVEDRLLEILKARDVISEAEYAELSALAREMRSEASSDREALEREIERYVAEAKSAAAEGGASGGFQTGYADGFYLKSADGKYSMTLGGYLQVRYAYVDADDTSSSSGAPLDPGFSILGRPASTDTSTINIPHGRFFVDGNVIDETVRYRMFLETAGSSVTLLDYFIDYTRFDPFNIKIGQYKVPYSRQDQTDEAYLLFPDFARVTQFFAPARGGGAGVTAHGMLGGDNDDLFEYNAGVFNGEGQNVSGNDGPGLMGAARVAVNPLGSFGYDETAVNAPEDFRFAAGAGVVYDADDSVTVASIPVGDVDTTTWGLDAAARFSGFVAQAEYFATNFDPDASGSSDFDFWGWYAQLGYMIPETTFQLAARYGMLTDDDGLFGGSENDFDEWSLGANYYFKANRAKIQADWTRLTFDPDGGSEIDDDVFRLQVQLMF